MICKKFTGSVIVFLSASFFAAGAHAGDSDAAVKYQECLVKERAEVDSNLFQFESGGGMIVWQGSSIPFVCDATEGLVKESKSNQLSRLIETFELSRMVMFSETENIKYTTCKLFVNRQATDALDEVKMPTYFLNWTMIVEDINGGANFFLECFVGTEPHVRAFPADKGEL